VKKVTLVLSFLLLGGWLPSAESAPPMVTPLSITDGTDLNITTPDSWKVTKIQPDAAIPPTLKISSPAQEVVLQVTFLPDKLAKFDSQEKVDKVVQGSSAHYVGGSVEKATTVQKMTVANGIGSLAEFTDADLVGKTTKPGQFKVVATGLITIGKTAAAFTLLGDSFDQAEYIEAKKILTDGISAQGGAPEEK
jgi:hypothetical protein